MTTVAVFTVTAVVSVIAELDPAVLDLWKRSPAGLHSDWWRTFTALLVQDGGISGTASNLLFLLIIGLIGEQVLSSPRWLFQYFGVGLTTELVAYLWQPTGAGNSIAICGLAGAVAVAYCQHQHRVPVMAAQIVAVWTGVVVSTSCHALSTVPILAGFAVAAALGLLHRRGINFRTPFMSLILAVAVVLTDLSNIHGLALLLGCACAVASERSAQTSHTNSRKTGNSINS